MTKEEFKTLNIGDIVMEGNVHLIKIDSITRNSIVYKENGYFHEIDLEYIEKVHNKLYSQIYICLYRFKKKIKKIIKKIKIFYKNL